MTRQEGDDGQVDGSASCEATLGAARESALGIVLSCAFWVSLAVSAALFALVVLAPKLLTHRELQDEAYVNQVCLVTLEGQVERLEKAATALKNDPELATEMLRSEFGAARPGDERIRVDSELSAAAPPPPPEVATPPASFESFQPVLEAFGRRRGLRLTSLAAAAVLTLLAFTFLHERGPA
jgi:hypothetical protein